MKKLHTVVVFLFLIASSFTYAQTPLPVPKNDTEARNVETIRLWLEEVWGNWRTELVADLVTPEYTRHEGSETRVVSREEYISDIERGQGRSAKFTQHAMSIDNNLLWTRWSGDVTARSGDHIELKGIQIYRFDNGRLTETWVMQERGNPWPDD